MCVCEGGGGRNWSIKQLMLSRVSLILFMSLRIPNFIVCHLVLQQHSDIEKDVLRVEKAGEEAKKQFMRERMEKDHCSDPVKQICLKTIGDRKKFVKLTTTKKGVIEYRQQCNISSNY